MIRLYVSLCLVSCTFIVGCRPESDTVIDASGVSIKLPHEWRISISDDGELSNSVTQVPIIYAGSNALVGANLKKERSIIAIDAISGEKKWEWQDLLSLKQNPTYKDPIDIWGECFHINKDKLFFSYRTSSYCIDLASGQTAWKLKNNLARIDITGGLGDMYLTPGGTYGLSDDERLYIGYLSDPKPERLLLTPAYKQVDEPLFNGFGMIRGVIPFINQRDTLISLLCYDQIADRHQTKLTTFSALYSLSRHVWVYDRAVMNTNGTEGVQNPILFGQKMYYNSLRELICYDVMTGNVLWSKPFTQAFSSLLLADEKLYGNNEDRYTYCFDPSSGQQLWREESSGTSSPLTYLNGVIYFLGGGDGKLHAIETKTGKHLWRLRSPDVDRNAGAFFYGTCVAVAGKGGNKGRIVATTGLNAYGYEAIR